MTRDEWMVSTDPAAMLWWVTCDGPSGSGQADLERWRNRPSDRKLRLFSLHLERKYAAGREVSLVRAKCDMAEKWLDGLATLADVWCARNPRRIATMEDAHRSLNDADGEAVTWVEGEASDWAAGHLQLCAAILRDLIGDPFAPQKINAPLTCSKGHLASDGKTALSPLKRDLFPVLLSMCRICNEVGPPWPDVQKGKPPVWLTPEVLSLAQATYEERLGDGTLDPARLAVLSDALEESGADGEKCEECNGKGGSWFCPGCRGEWRGDVGPDCFVCGAPYLTRKTCNACRGDGIVPNPLLAHLRSPGKHWRGMWSLDLLLEKS